MEVDVMKIAVITGASSGLGREFARQINQHFVTLDEVWLIARREERLNELKESLHGVHVGQFRLICATGMPLGLTRKCCRNSIHRSACL